MSENMTKYYHDHKCNNGHIKKHVMQKRYESLLHFVNNSCYWTRFNWNADKKEWLHDNITGKYLNQIHHYFIKFNFYDSIYQDVLNKYLISTDFKTLNNLSIDSFFVRNIEGIGLSRNPIYHNKPGFKIHTLVDSNRVAISIIITDCNISDSVVVQRLIVNKFIDNSIFQKHCHIFLADSAYSGFTTIEYLTSIGLKIVMGHNKQYTKKTSQIKSASNDDVIFYKKRGAVENLFSHIAKIPCLINNYEKTINSYRGLLMFYLASYLAKKTNKIMKEIQDEKLKECNDINRSEKKRLQQQRKNNKYIQKKVEKERLDKEAVDRKTITQQKLAILRDTIWMNVDKKIVTMQYDISLQEYNKKTKNLKKSRGRPKKIDFQVYEKYMKTELCDYIKNNVLTETVTYVFAKKTLHMIKADSYAFTDTAITTKMTSININSILQEFTNNFFV